MLLDRHIIARFVTNFVLLFVLLFLFVVAIDLVMALDKFTGVAQDVVGEEGGRLTFLLTFLRLVVDFQSPRLFQFYAYLHGLVAVGAMGFTLAQMYRHRELVAILAAGISMHRIAMPFIVATFGISIVQVLNQELLLPRVAPLLLRGHRQIGSETIQEFPIPLTADGRGNLLQSPLFDPDARTLKAPTILERDERGRTVRRIIASEARWGSSADADGAMIEGWELTDGRAVHLGLAGPESSTARSAEVVGFYVTDLSPELLMVRRYGQFAAMLSLRQIDEMLAVPGTPHRDTLRRYRVVRFASVLVNILVMWLTLPSFLLREPSNLLGRTVLCAGTAIPALLGAAVFMVVDLPGISPAVGVFLPVAILIPVVLAQWTYVKT